MSECRNLASLTSSPALQSVPTVHQLAREIDGLRAKVAALELELQRMEGRKVSRRVVEDMILKSKQGRPRKAPPKPSGLATVGNSSRKLGTALRAMEKWVEAEITRLDQRCKDRVRNGKYDATPKP